MNPKIMTVLVSAFILQGCFEQFERGEPVEERIMDTKQSVALKVKSRKFDSIANSLDMGDTTLFYIAQGRDPFVASGSFKGVFDYGDFDIAVQSKVRLKHDPERPEGYKPGPLEKYELDNLKMIGVISLQNGETAALIDDGKGKIIMARVGDYIGRDFGRINKITERDIFIDEKFAPGNKEDPNAWVSAPNKISLKIK